MTDAAPQPGPASPAPQQQAQIATLAGGGVSAVSILWILWQLQTSVADMSGRVAVLGEQVSAARGQVSEVRSAQLDMTRDLDAIERRMAVIEAQRDAPSRK